MKVVITGGGTGGHLSVASAFIDEFKNRGFVCVFVGSKGGQDRAFFENDNRLEKKIFFDTQGVVNQKGFKKIQSLFAHLKALKEANKILKLEKPDFVLSVGGYSAAPCAFGAVFNKIPLIIHEQNAKIGRLNQLLKNRARIFFSSYEESSPCKFYPIKQDFFKNARVRSEVKNILIMGGSQGARALNNFALSFACDLKEKKIRLFHQCGKNDFENLQKEYSALNLKLKIFDSMEEKDLADLEFDVGLFAFSKIMPKVMNLCDFAISRSGASSLWELCANGLPALFIPYPYAASNHQYFNAKFLEDKNIGFLCDEKVLYDKVLWDILECFKGSEMLSKMSKEVQEECSKSAVSEMVDIILERI